eukprot:scaffold56135_cov28-Tisochrysis_lutea.AAC.7
MSRKSASNNGYSHGRRGWCDNGGHLKMEVYASGNGVAWRVSRAHVGRARTRVAIMAGSHLFD